MKLEIDLHIYPHDSGVPDNYKEILRLLNIIINKEVVMSKAIDDLAVSVQALDDDVDAAIAKINAGGDLSAADTQKLVDIRAALDAHKAALDAALGTTPPPAGGGATPAA